MLVAGTPINSILNWDISKGMKELQVVLRCDTSLSNTLAIKTRWCTVQQDIHGDIAHMLYTLIKNTVLKNMLHKWYGWHGVEKVIIWLLFLECVVGYNIFYKWGISALSILSICTKNWSHWWPFESLQYWWEYWRFTLERNHKIRNNIATGFWNTILTI